MWAALGNAVNCVLSLFTLAFVGFILARKGWFTPESKLLISRLVLIVTLPVYLFRNIVTSFSREELLSLLSGVIVPVLSIFITFLFGLALTKLTAMPRKRAGLFSSTIATSNTIFIGLPVSVALFGEAALPYVLLYFFANTAFFWTIGRYQISLSGGRAPKKILSAATFKELMSPPLVGFLLGVLAVLTDIRLPRFLMDGAGYLGSLTMPLAIIFLGLTLASADLKNLAPDRDIRLLLLGRFVVSPLTIILLTLIIKIPPLMAQVFIILSSLPTSTSAPLLALYYDADVKFASAVFTLTTLLSLATIPFYMMVIFLLSHLTL